jgi:hypothetical protein
MVVASGVTAIRAVTRGPFGLEARTEFDFEVPLAIRLWAFAPRKTVLICPDRDRYAVAESPKVIHHTISASRSVFFTRSSPEMSLGSSVSRNVARVRFSK